MSNPGRVSQLNAWLLICGTRPHMREHDSREGEQTILNPDLTDEI